MYAARTTSTREICVVGPRPGDAGLRRLLADLGTHRLKLHGVVLAGCEITVLLGPGADSDALRRFVASCNDT